MNRYTEKRLISLEKQLGTDDSIVMIGDIAVKASWLRGWWPKIWEQIEGKTTGLPSDDKVPDNPLVVID